jgi:orotate phosphoribosyltransferase-like protein
MSAVTPPTVTGSVNALSGAGASFDPATLVNDIIKALETPGTSAETVATYIGEALAAIGLVVGAFDHPLGLAISAVPQAAVLAASTIAAAGIAIYRLFTKSKKQQVAAQLVGQMHWAQMSALGLPATPAT